MKTDRQRAFEARIRQSRGLAHPASPAAGGTEWTTRCARTECGRTFLTPTKQRKYCSDECRRQVEQSRARRAAHVEGLLLFTCAAPNCTEVFMPENAEHQYCSNKCRKRAHRANSDLSPTRCAWCKIPLPTRKTRRLRYCGATCRKRASRQNATAQPTLD